MVKKVIKKVKYLTNKDFLAEIIECKKTGKMSEKLGGMFLKLTKKYASKSCWAGYTYNDDMQSEAMIHICRGWLGFDPEKSNNPFAYFTSLIHNAFLQFLKKEKKVSHIKNLLKIESGMSPTWSFDDGDGGENGDVNENGVVNENDSHLDE